MICKGDLCDVKSDYLAWKSEVPIYKIDQADQLVKGGLVQSGAAIVVLDGIEVLKNIYYENYYYVLTHLGPFYIHCSNVKKTDEQNDKRG